MSREQEQEALPRLLEMLNESSGLLPDLQNISASYLLLSACTDEELQRFKEAEIRAPSSFADSPIFGEKEKTTEEKEEKEEQGEQEENGEKGGKEEAEEEEAEKEKTEEEKYIEDEKGSEQGPPRKRQRLI